MRRIESLAEFKRHQREWAERGRERHYRACFGLTVADYEALLEYQRHTCAICRRDPYPKRLVVDHDHKTGVVRGLLCDKCNRGIGLLGDDAEGLERAAEYLASRGSPDTMENVYFLSPAVMHDSEAI